MAEQNKKTIYVGGLPEAIDEAGLVSVFSPFGDIIDVQIPREGKQGRHRGFGFITFSNRTEAEDAIDNMHLNTIPASIPAPGAQSQPQSKQHERIINVTLAKPLRTAMTAAGNRAVWASEEWIKQYGSGEEKAAAGVGAGAGEEGDAMDEDS